MRNPDNTWETAHFRGRFVEAPASEAGKGAQRIPFMAGPAGGEVLVLLWATIPGQGIHRVYWEDVKGALWITYRLPDDAGEMSWPIVAGAPLENMTAIAMDQARDIARDWRLPGVPPPVVLTRAQIARELAPLVKLFAGSDLVQETVAS